MSHRPNEEDSMVSSSCSNSAPSAPTSPRRDPRAPTSAYRLPLIALLVVVAGSAPVVACTSGPYADFDPADTAHALDVGTEGRSSSDVDTPAMTPYEEVIVLGDASISGSRKGAAPQPWLACPPGRHPIEYYFNASAPNYGLGWDNAVTCHDTTGLSFSSCEPCPPPYTAVSVTPQAGPLMPCHPLAPGTLWSGVMPLQYQCHIGASFGASPWEARLGPRETFYTTLTWHGGGATNIRVVARPPNRPEIELSTDHDGSLSYGPIAGGESHGIQLWGDGMLLYNYGVVGRGPTATITATPDRVVAPASTTNLVWSTSDVSSARLVRRIDGGAPQIIDTRVAGQRVETISPGHRYLYTVVYGATATSPTLSEVTVIGENPPLAPTPQGGLWDDLSRPNNGLDVRFLGNSDGVVMTWYTFDPGGAPIWYQAILSRGPSAWTGELYRTRWTGTGITATVVGAASLELTSSDRGELVWQLDGSSGRDSVAWFWGAGGSPDLGGLWYDATESGWGLGLLSQGSTHVGYLQAYAGSAPTWVFGTSNGSGSHFDFPLAGVTGVNACPGCSGPVSISTWDAGTMTIDAPLAWQGTATATINATLAGDVWQRTSRTITRITP